MQCYSLFYLETSLHVSGGTITHHQERKQLYLQHLAFVTPLSLSAGGRCQAQCAWQRPPAARPTTFYVWKTRGCQCSFRLLMMGGVSPKTCWASYKYGIIKLWYIFASCWIFFMNCTVMHGSTNINVLKKFVIIVNFLGLQITIFSYL